MRQGRTAAAVVALTLGALGLGWMTWPASSPSQGGEVTAPMVPTAPPLPSSAMPAPALARAGPASDPMPILPPGWVEVCHASPVPQVRSHAELDRVSRDQVVPALHQALAGLLVHPDPRMRAAGQLLVINQRHLDAASRAMLPECWQGGCPDRPPPVDEGGVRREIGRHRDALVRQAIEGRDPIVYGLALQACSSPFLGPERGACSQLSAAEWARREPDNRQAWWRVASEAEARGDSRARDDALAQAVAAPRDDNHLGPVVDAALAAVPETAPGWLQGPTMMLVVGAWTTSMIAMPPVAAPCRPEHLGDTNVRQPCERLAEVLLRQPASRIDRALGAGLARKLGWPAERLPNDRDQLMAQAEAANRLLTSEDEPTSCRTVTEQRRWLSELAQYGELGAEDRLVERSGVDPAVLRREAEARVARLTEAARQAGSAASAP